MTNNIPITPGWVFYAADFSITPGRVTLKRDEAQTELWHRHRNNTLDENCDTDGPELFVTGTGITLNDAIIQANDKAAYEGRIPEIF